MKRGEKGTLYERIARDIEELIDTGSLVPGDRIPSLREMGVKARASVSSVLEAYMLLENRGLVEARPQSGFYVKPRLTPPLSRELSPPPVEWPRGSAEELILPAFVRAATDPKHVPLTEASPHPSLLPTKHLYRILGKLCRASDERLLLFEHPQGNADLRKQIAKRASLAGTTILPEEVIITHGGVESWNLCLRSVARPGGQILVGSPTHFGVFELIENLGMRATELPCHTEGGIDMAALGKLVARQRFDACLVMPNLSHPLGFLFPEWNKEEMLQLLTRAGIPLIEDDVYGDLAFGAKRAITFKSLDKKGLVLHCASFSKTISPGFRVSWVAPGRFTSEMLRQRFLGSLSSVTLPQAVLAEYLVTGSYDRHLRLVRKRLVAQCALASKAVAEHFPSQTCFIPPAGGFAAWVRLPDGVDAVKLHHRALARGIAIAPGPAFSNLGYFNEFLRLGFTQPWSPVLDRAYATLGQLVQESRARSSRPTKADNTTAAASKQQLVLQ